MHDRNNIPIVVVMLQNFSKYKIIRLVERIKCYKNDYSKFNDFNDR